MTNLVSLILAVLLAFSYKIVDITVGFLVGKAMYRKIEKEIIYIWGILLTVGIYFYDDNYVFRLPIQYKQVVLLILITAITNIVISRYSGYNPRGKWNVLNFVFIYPIFEEVLFRGMILPMLNNSFPTHSLIEIFYAPVTVPILLSSFLFAVAHLQYYSFNKTSIKFMIFAFCGGIIFGIITNHSLSIIFSIFLHVEFNFLSAYYSNTFKFNGKFSIFNNQS